MIIRSILLLSLIFFEGRSSHYDQQPQFVVNVRSLCVRSGPGNGFPIVDRLSYMTPVSVDSIGNGWYRVFYYKDSYRDGYVLKKCLAPI